MNNNRSTFDYAGFKPLQKPYPFNVDHRIFMSAQRTKDQPVSYARNFKLRLFNVDPEEQRRNEIIKENYKKQLQLQVEQQRRKKQLQIRKIKEQDQKYEKAFLSKIEAKNSPKKEQPAYFIMRSAQRNRFNSEKKQNITEPEVRVSRISFSPVVQKSKQETTKLPSLIFNKQARPEKNSDLMDFHYEDQRMQRIQYFQENLLHKMDDLKHQIKRTSSNLEIEHQIQKIRSLLQGKTSALLDSSQTDKYDQDYYYKLSSQQYRTNPRQDSNNYKNFMKLDESRSRSTFKPLYEANLKTEQSRRIPTQSENLQQQYDKVEIVDFTPSKAKKNRKYLKYKRTGNKNQQQKSRYRQLDNSEESSDHKIASMLYTLDNLIHYYDK